MSEPSTTAGPALYAEDDNVKAILGRLALPATVTVPAHLSIAHTEVVAALRKVYGDDLPQLTGDAAEAARWAEAKLAAASILSTLLFTVENANLETVRELRADARATLAGPLPGFDPDTTDPDGPGPAKALSPAPVAFSGGGSLFADPYAYADLARVRPVPGEPGWVDYWQA